MSSITGLISGGGGGGETHIVTDPKKLSRTAVSRVYVKNSVANLDSRSSAFFSVLTNSTNMGAQVATTTSDTYVTLLNVSNADGGYLHWLLSTGISTANESSTVKITVDGGTPVELTYQPSTIQSNIGTNRMFLGGGLQVATTTTGSALDGAEYNYWNAFWAGMSGSSAKNLEDSTNNVYANQSIYSQGYLQNDLNILRNMPYQRLYFTSSLLIEVKQSTYSTADGANYAGCIYSLI